ncbi:MAG: hypothetical protein QJR02_02060 [Sinobacteraceae bacterium]|nr:hypothetical protein [Nevskiaceae bacterium]
MLLQVSRLEPTEEQRRPWIAKRRGWYPLSVALGAPQSVLGAIFELGKGKARPDGKTRQLPVFQGLLNINRTWRGGIEFSRSDHAPQTATNRSV